MFRELQVAQKNVAAQYTADDDFVQGMVGVKNGEVVELPTAGAKDLFFVTRERIPTGIESVVEASDYDDRYEVIPKGVKVKLFKLGQGERVAVDQIDGTPTSGTYLIATATGKLTAQTAGTTSVLMCKGTYADGDKTLYIVEGVEPNTTSAS